MQISAKTVSLGKNEIKFTTLEEISDVRTGLGTGDNKHYFYKTQNALGPYKIIDKPKVLTEEEISKISNDEKLRIKIIENGIHKNMFNGKTIVPCDKGGSSDIEAGRLNNYYSEPEFFIDWSEANVSRMKTLTIAERNRLDGKNEFKPHYETTLACVFRNMEYNFKEAITFPMAGIYAPTFKINLNSIFDHGGNCFFILDNFRVFFNNYYLLGILCSKLEKYLFTVYINNTVGVQVNNIKNCIIPIPESKIKQKIENLVKEIIKKQKKDPDYNYQDHEQKEIDKLVYEIFGLDQELIDEVETWYARRYPKLVRTSPES